MTDNMSTKYVELFYESVKAVQKGKDLLLTTPELKNKLDGLILRDAVLILGLSGEINIAKGIIARGHEDKSPNEDVERVLLHHFKGENSAYDAKWVKASVEVMKYISSLLPEADRYMTLTVQMILEKAAEDPRWVSTMHKALSLRNPTKLMVMATMLYSHQEGMQI